jgi:hypothetical protein
MKIKIISIIVLLLFFIPMATANDYISENCNAVSDINEGKQPCPCFGKAFVFYLGKAEVYESDESNPDDIAIKTFSNKIRLICFGFGSPRFGPLFESFKGNYIITLDDYRGYIGPKPIVEGENINYIFAWVQNVIVSLP